MAAEQAAESWLDEREPREPRWQPRPYEPSPCDQCPNVARCARERLACAAFLAFVRRSHGTCWQSAPRVPAREFFVRSAAA